ncbi:MAG: DoxX family protein [Candidatus Niyogibacteria bacterium]|nr:MAG: DoxX family protein [Candidatus Niyogibacteria bacterium]
MLNLFPGFLDYGFFAPLLLRLIVGLIFVAHGYPKLFGGFSQTVGFFESVGIKPAKFWVFVVGVVEFFGGIALIVGFATQLAALLIAIDMLVAIWKVKAKQGFVGGYEFDLMLLVAALSLVLTGAGAYAIDLPL